MSLKITLVCLVLFILICLVEIATAQQISPVVCQQPTVAEGLIGIGNCTALLPLIVG